MANQNLPKTLPEPMERAIAEALKDNFVLKDIETFFGLADAQPDWKVIPVVNERDGERVTCALSWLQGVRQKAPREHLRISRSVIEQIIECSHISEKHQRILQRVIVRIDQLESQEVAVASKVSSPISATSSKALSNPVLYTAGLEMPDQFDIELIRDRLDTFMHTLDLGIELDSRCDQVIEKLRSIRFEILNPELWSNYVALVVELEEFYDEFWGWNFDRNAIEPSSNSLYQRNALKRLVGTVSGYSIEQFRQAQDMYLAARTAKRINEGRIPKVFIAHGGRQDYLTIHNFIRDKLGVDVVVFETHNRAARQIAEILEEMVSETTAAIGVMTAEDSMDGERIRARQNVIHEIGLFQGRLGFHRVAMVKESSAEKFSNMDGVIYIPFDPKYPQGSFHDIEAWLREIKIVD